MMAYISSHFARRRNVMAIRIVLGLTCGATSLGAQTVGSHSISRVALESGSAVALTLTGTPPSAFQRYFDLFPLEASTSLVEWQPLATVVRTNVTNDVLYLDTAAAGQSMRFYRTPTNQFSTPFLVPTGPFKVG